MFALAASSIRGLLRLRRRRRRRAKALPDPSSARWRALESRQFFGREQLVQRILETAHNNSLLLVGERSIGKTSLLLHLKARLESHADAGFAFYPVYVDLGRISGESLFTALAYEIMSQLRNEIQGLEPEPSSAGGDGFRQLVCDLKRVLDHLRQAGNPRPRVVLLLDNADRLNHFDPRINQRLRSLFMRDLDDGLVALLAGVEIHKRWEREGSPWYNFFEEMEVGPLDAAEARQLVTAPLEGRVAFEPTAVEHILEAGNGRPAMLDQICTALVVRLSARGGNRVTIEDVAAVLAEM